MQSSNRKDTISRRSSGNVVEKGYFNPIACLTVKDERYIT
jgi:hypothetical protein